MWRLLRGALLLAFNGRNRCDGASGVNPPNSKPTTDKQP